MATVFPRHEAVILARVEKINSDLEAV